MDQEIDLREYIAVLLKYKYWIVGLAVGAAVVAMAVSFLLSPTYQATALVAITKPRYEMQFDPRFELPPGNYQPPYKAYPLLAMGDEVLSALISDLGDELAPEQRNVAAIRGMVEAQNGSDPSIVQLRVSGGDPQRTAAIANSWAARFVERANDLYAPDKDDLVFFEEQLTEAEAALAKAEQDLIDFQAGNQATIFTTQLDDKETALKDYLSAARSLRLIIQDARSLRDRLRSQSATAPASPSDELTSLLLEIDALNRSELPIQLQVSVQQDMGGKTIGDQIAFLDSLITVLEGKLVLLEQEAQSLEPDLLSLQERLQVAETQEERLTTARKLALDTFTALSRKVAEASIAAQDTTGDVRLASRAAVPRDPVSPRKLLNAAIAGVLGIIVGVLAAFAIEYWRQGRSEAEPADG
jgi:uncharacterized protein involved in exopolysaccharide biosynthesis